jgi:NAD(P)-dependent dehydrogenase (short-subunit alcohol dehydrogenase family)
MGIYCSSKFAVEALTQGLRFELRHFGICVTQVEPGSFLTGGFVKNVKRPKQGNSEDSPYKELNTYFFDKYYAAHAKAEKSPILQNLLNQQKVVNLIYSIAQKEKPKARYLIGIDAHIYYFFRRLLPESIWEYVLHKVYRW